MNHAKRLLQQSSRVVHSAERRLCFRFVGKDRASSFLPQIKMLDFLNGFLNGDLRAKKSMGYVWILVF